MTLGEFVSDYRKKHGFSIRYFASIAGMSPQQISNIEKGIGNDGKPMTSTMKTYRKIAKAVGLDEKVFMAMLNDNVLVNPSDEKIPVTDGDGQEEKYEEVKDILNQLTQENAESLREYALFLLQRQKSQDDQ